MGDHSIIHMYPNRVSDVILTCFYLHSNIHGFITLEPAEEVIENTNLVQNGN